MTTETITKLLDLQRFCANEHDISDYLRAPFREGDCVYATNGHMIVRVLRDEAPDAPERTSRQPNNVEALFASAFAAPGQFAPLPPVTHLPPDKACSECGGTGFVHYDDEDETCLQCNGLGFWSEPMDVNDAAFNVHYLHMLASLPSASIKTNGAKGAAAIQFDGGQALLMPVRK